VGIRGQPSPRALGYAALIVVGGGVLLATLWVLSGGYNVAASAKHFYVTDWMLKLVLYRSVDTYSSGIEVPALDDPGLVQLGARHFATGCQPCHAGPGIDQSPIVSSMYPAAPQLGYNVKDWEKRELFWVVRHGLKFTGMPHWPGAGRDDEVWAVVAFLGQLPDMSPQQYAELTGVTNAGERGFSLGGPASAATCLGCHGDADNAPVAQLVPSLNGQNAAYLVRALEAYAAGKRESGMMEPLATAMSASDRERYAADFAALAPPAPAAPRGEGSTRGEQIAAEGIARQNIPPCAACHSSGKSGQFPRLEGLSAKYIATQLRLFRAGTRSGTPYAAIMAPIAERLTDEQIADVAAYFSGLHRETASANADDGEVAR
jgi:cytochrome c553